MKLIGRFLIAILIFYLLSAAVTFVQQAWVGILIVLLPIPLYFIIRHILMRRYFASPEFLDHKKAITEVVREHNEISDYIQEIRNNGRFKLGRSSSGLSSNLATFENTSKHAYKRDRNNFDSQPDYVHHASLQVVRNASLEPIRYLIKYFDIQATEEKLEEVEQLGESISRLENAVQNLKERESDISEKISPPRFILAHYLERFQAEVGLSVPALSIPYPVYSFQYVSAGGNSSQRADIKLDSQTVDALIEELSERIKFRKSAAGQRALMTAKLRSAIKQRDEYTCQICSISVSQEPHLLLEVDHIKPISRGGLSIIENLQTLCWKCNRSKSNRES